jgi:two-component system, sensor histidine kinase and response regulator
MPPHQSERDLSFLNGGGEMGQLMRHHDWAASPMGAPHTWPQGLRTAMRLLLNSHHPMCIFWGRAGYFIYNDAYSPSLGPEQHPSCLGKPGAEVWSHLWDMVLPQIEQVLAGDGSTWHENQKVLMLRDGVLREAYWTYGFSPIDDGSPGSGVGGALVVGSETTQQLALAQRTDELKVVNEALKHAAQFTATLTNAIPGRVVYWTSEYVCTFANRAFADWFGTTPEKLIGRRAHEVHDAEYLAKIWPDVEAAFAGERQHLIRETRDARNRQLTHKVDYIPDFAPDGTVRGICVVGFDVTELKAAQNELQDTIKALAASRDEAQQATRAKSAFLANMSHEIRTPMNAIIGLTHLMTRDTQDAAQRERLGKVANAAQHLLMLINDILDLSKIEAGKLDLAMADFTFPSVIARATELIALRAKEKGLEIIVDTDGVPTHLRGDATRLAQILINLLTNAVKFTNAGWIRISAKVEEQVGRLVKLCIEVQDTGPGIPLEQQAELFSAFTQADNSISRQHGGTGLGLTLSRQLARAMEGEAGVRSQPGEGSTFWFSVWLELGAAQTAPVTLAAPPTLAAPIAPSASSARIVAAADGEAMLRRGHAGQRVLLAEDNDVNREIAQDLLQSVGLVVETAVNGLRAVELGQSRRYDLVLMDVQMPGMDGLEATRTLRATVGNRMPIVAMTANAFVEDRANCLAAGMNDHVAKPVDPATLYSILLRWLPQKAPSPAEGRSALVASAASAADAGADDLAHLRTIEGLDVDAGLTLVGGRASTYSRVLERFADTYREGVPAWFDTSGDAQQRHARWHDACHSVRGALSTIGATALSEKVGAFERALHVSQAEAAHLDNARALQQQITQLVADIQVRLNNA